jgi:hypothetical protein
LASRLTNCSEDLLTYHKGSQNPASVAQGSACSCKTKPALCARTIAPSTLLSPATQPFCRLPSFSLLRLLLSQTRLSSFPHKLFPNLSSPPHWPPLPCQKTANPGLRSVFFFPLLFLEKFNNKVSKFSRIQTTKNDIFQHFPNSFVEKWRNFPKKNTGSTHDFFYRTCIFHLPSNYLPYYPTYLLLDSPEVVKGITSKNKLTLIRVFLFQIPQVGPLLRILNIY